MYNKVKISVDVHNRYELRQKWLPTQRLQNFTAS